jgi:hypothetical protein
MTSAGKTVTFELCDKTPLISRQAILASGERSMLLLSDDKTCAGAASTNIYIGNLERGQVVREMDFKKGDAEVPQVSCAEATSLERSQTTEPWHMWFSYDSCYGNSAVHKATAEAAWQPSEREASSKTN